MVGWHHWLSGHEFEQALEVGNGLGSLGSCNPWGRKELDTAEQLNSNNTYRCGILGKWTFSHLRFFVSKIVLILANMLKTWHEKQGLPGGTVVRNPPANERDARDSSLILGSGRSPREGDGNSLQYSCLENSMDRGVWWATLHGVACSQTRRRDWANTHLRSE